MAQVQYKNDSRIFNLEKTANEILNELVPLEHLQHVDLFFHARKIGRNTKLSEIKGIETGKTLRILERKSMPLKPPKDIREQAVAISQKLERLGPLHSRLMAERIKKLDYIQELLQKYPIIHEQPILMNVLTDFALIRAMLLEEHGFIHQHPFFVEIVKDLIGDNNMANIPELNDIFRRFQRRSVREQQPTTDNRRPQQAAFTSQMLQQALAQTLVGQQSQPAAAVAGSSTGQGQDAAALYEPMEVDPPCVQPAPPVDYSQQNAQLHDLGFTDDNLNITALTNSGGDIENAIEIIISLRNQMDDLD